MNLRKRKVMKRTALSIILASAIANTCFGAAAVKLNNYDSNNGAGAPIYFFCPPGTLGIGQYVQIYANGTPLVSTGGGNGIFSLADDPGFFDGGIANIPGIPDYAQATFTLWVWRGEGTLAGLAAARALGMFGVTTWTQATGNLFAPATLNIPAVGMPFCPEPTTWAMVLIGTSMLLIFHRRQG